MSRDLCQKNCWWSLWRKSVAALILEGPWWDTIFFWLSRLWPLCELPSFQIPFMSRMKFEFQRRTTIHDEPRCMDPRNNGTTWTASLKREMHWALTAAWIQLSVFDQVYNSFTKRSPMSEVFILSNVYHLQDSGLQQTSKGRQRRSDQQTW